MYVHTNLYSTYIVCMLSTVLNHTGAYSNSDTVLMCTHSTHHSCMHKVLKYKVLDCTVLQTNVCSSVVLFYAPRTTGADLSF